MWFKKESLGSRSTIQKNTWCYWTDEKERIQVDQARLVGDIRILATIHRVSGDIAFDIVGTNIWVGRLR